VHLVDIDCICLFAYDAARSSSTTTFYKHHLSIKRICSVESSPTITKPTLDRSHHNFTIIIIDTTTGNLLIPSLYRLNDAAPTNRRIN
jgi:hypothetical protein